MSPSLVAYLSVIGFLPTVEANAFLGGVAERNFEPLLNELELVLGQEQRTKVEGRVDSLMEALRPTFQALPKTSNDHLEPAAVRYLLHRYFLDRHGWFVQGFEHHGDAWNSTSPAALFGQHLGSDAQEVFDQRMEVRGLSLHEVAVLAATLESLVHEETIERLHAAYRLAGLLQVEQDARDAEVDTAMDTYMLMYVMGLNHSTVTEQAMKTKWSKVDFEYPQWAATTKWMRGVREEALRAHPEGRGSFETTTAVLEEVADRYGRWQDQECGELKAALVALDPAGTGRVPLRSFYGASLNGSYFFSESKAFLRLTGSLDETDPRRPSVIIPNYINGPSNCLASSKFYEVCCINECEALLGHLERELAAPEAKPTRIVELVEQLPSATVDAPRELPNLLTQRLDDIALQHGGDVPLHGRLFMQWLHHAYPRECPFPHVSGTSKHMTRQGWKDSFGEQVVSNKETMRWHVEQEQQSASLRDRDTVANPALDGAASEAPWLEEEELYAGRSALPALSDEPFPVCKGILLAAVACSMMMTLMPMLAKARESVDALPQTKPTFSI